MKKPLTIVAPLVGIVVIIAVLFFAFTYQKSTPAEPAVTVIPVQALPKPKKTLGADDGTFCFVRTQVATESAPFSSTEHIVMTRTGSAISGTKSGTQSGPGVSNGFTGTINGAIVGNAVTVVYAYTVEGSQGKEQEEYEVASTELIKHHYQLKDFKGTLVPDKTKTERDSLVYTPEPCL